MHFEILNNDQKNLLPYLQKFNRTFYLVGGTAIALHIGHRRSIDFDLFSKSSFNKYRIKAKLKDIPLKQIPIFEDIDQLHIKIDNVKLTFFNFPYNIDHPVKVKSYINMPKLLTLAAMKAYALGHRAKWKDYVDMYYIIKEHFSISEICKAANKYFGDQFSEKLFRQQLAYHKDINYSEQIEYMIKPVPENEIKKFLIEKATDIGI